MVSLNPFKWGWIRKPILKKIYNDAVEGLDANAKLFTSTKRTGMDVIVDGIDEYLRKGTTYDKLKRLLNHFLKIYDSYEEALLKINALGTKKDSKNIEEASVLMNDMMMKEKFYNSVKCYNECYPLMKRMRVLVLEMLIALDKKNKSRLAGLAENYKLNVQKFKTVGQKHGY